MSANERIYAGALRLGPWTAGWSIVFSGPPLGTTVAAILNKNKTLAEIVATVLLLQATRVTHRLVRIYIRRLRRFAVRYNEIDGDDSNNDSSAMV